MKSILDAVNLRHRGTILRVRVISVRYIFVGSRDYGTILGASIRARSCECCEDVCPDTRQLHGRRFDSLGVVDLNNADDWQKGVVCVSRIWRECRWRYRSFRRRYDMYEVNKRAT